MSGIQSPQMLSDLYRDLRDRRLLPLVLVLVVGMAVVPIALSSSPDTPPPTPLPPPASATVKSNAPDEQVVVSNPGIRDYKRRLRDDAPVDPFIQQFTGGGTVTDVAAGAGGGVSSAGIAPAGSTGTTPSLSGGGTTTIAPSPTGGTTQSEPTTRYYSYRVKLRAGKVGEDLKVYDSVGPLAEVPGKRVPALVFLGVSKSSSVSARRAVFLVSNGVSSLDGEGSCSFAGDQCQLLSLKPGEHEDVIWLDGTAYRIQLVKFNVVARNKLPGIGTDGDPNPRNLSVDAQR
jgi:hypothetical protein